MKRATLFVAALLLILSGCSISESEVKQAYQDGYSDGKHDATSTTEEEVKSAYNSGYEDGMTDAYNNMDFQPTYEDELWSEGYNQGLYDGYQERKKDEDAGAPDQYEDYENWFYFWNGVYPNEVPPPTSS